MTQHVLIVDDTEINRILIAALVKRLGDFHPVSMNSAQLGLDWLASHIPDLIVVDYMMPDIDGLEFIRRVREIPALQVVPILMVTANDHKQVRYRALDAGANDYLTKPIDKVEFLARARNMLVLGQAQRALADRAEWLSGEVRKATQEIRMRERETVFRLAKAAEYRDPETGGHILRMAHYSQLIARQLGFSQDEQDLLLEAAPMHDIGKVGIPDKILLKPGKLDAEEFETMKKHAVYGYELLKGSTSLVLQAGAEIARGHHEKFDGTGYPAGVKGTDIPIFSRIVAVADVFDALTSERPYKKAWTLEAAVDLLLQGAGTHFDPACVTGFLNAWEEVLAIRNTYQDDDVPLTASNMLPI